MGKKNKVQNSLNTCIGSFRSVNLFKENGLTPFAAETLSTESAKHTSSGNIIDIDASNGFDSRASIVTVLSFRF